MARIVLHPISSLVVKELSGTMKSSVAITQVLYQIHDAAEVLGARATKQQLSRQVRKLLQVLVHQTQTQLLTSVAQHQSIGKIIKTHQLSHKPNSLRLHVHPRVMVQVKVMENAGKKALMRFQMTVVNSFDACQTVKEDIRNMNSRARKVLHGIMHPKHVTIKMQ